MSIQTQIDRISRNVSAALSAIVEKGVTVPDGSTSDALAELITSIKAGGGNIASGSISWATAPINLVQTEFMHNLGVVPKLFLIHPTFDITSSTQKNIGIHLISTGSLGAISRYSNRSIKIYSDFSQYVMKSMQDFPVSETDAGVYADSTKLIFRTYLDSVFTVNPGDIYNWIAVG